MASGDAILNATTNGVNQHSRHPGSSRVEKHLLIDGAVATGNVLAWIPAAGVKRAAINVIGEDTADFTAQIRGTIPRTAGAAPAGNGFQLGADVVIATDKEQDFQLLAGGDTVEYIGAMISVYTTGTAYVVLILVY